MKGKLLFDASSLIYALKLKNIDILNENYIQHLTIYEAINAIWKETHLIKSLPPKKAVELIKLATEIIGNLNILSIHQYEPEIFKKATELDLTIYDASYIVLAEKNKLTLVTEDKKLARKAHNTIKTTSLKNIIKTQ